MRCPKCQTENPERYGMLFSLAHDYAVYAVLFKKGGDSHNARRKLGEAIDLFKKCGADGWMTECRKELAALS